MKHVANLDMRFCQEVTLPLYQLKNLKRFHMENIGKIRFLHSEPESYDEMQLDAKMSNFSIKDSMIENLIYNRLTNFTIDYLTFENVTFIDEVRFSNINITVLNISNSNINKIRQGSLDVNVAKEFVLKNNTFKEVDSLGFAKIR